MCLATVVRGEGETVCDSGVFEREWAKYSKLFQANEEVDAWFCYCHDPATLEVIEAYHDRRPIMPDRKEIADWLHHEKKYANQLDEVLKSSPEIPLKYGLSKLV